MKGRWSGAIHVFFATLAALTIFEVAPDPAVASTVIASVSPVSPDGTSGWYRTAPIVTLHASGDAGAFWTWGTWPGSSTLYAGPFSPGEGVSTLSFGASEDLLSTPDSLRLAYDATAPTYSLAVGGGRFTSSRSLRLRISARDEGGSGLSVMRLATFGVVGGTGGPGWVSADTASQVRLKKGSGWRKVHLRMRDVASNTGDPAQVRCGSIHIVLR